MTDTSATGRSEARRIAVIASAAIGLVGLALSLLDDKPLGAWLSVGGFVAMGWALHRFGRAGADPR